MLYHLLERSIEHAVIPWCEQHKVAVVAYSPFGHARFPGPQTAGGRMLAEIAGEIGATPRQTALAFLVRRPSVFAIPKAADPQHAEENAASGDLHLSAEQVGRLDAAFPLARRQRGLPML